MMGSSSQHTGCCSHRPGRALQILCSVLLLWGREMHGLSDFSSYLFRIINSHSAHARDGERALLSCPRHSTIAVHAAFYGQDGARAGNEISCSARTALQKMLSECQGHRHCQVLVHRHLFGRDPCPGTPKYLHVSYSCKPKCLYHGALNAVRSACYGKQWCLLAVDDQHFTNPCAPGTKTYLTVFYSCVPQSLLREADPDFFKTTSAPHETTKAGDFPHVRDSRLPENNGIILSSSLMTYGYIKEHAEMAGLLFVSGVCLGLLVVLLAVSVKLTCTRHLKGTGCLKKKQPEEPKTEDDDDDDDTDDEEESEPLMDSSVMSDVGRTVYCWEEMTYTTEAAELMERLERREMVIQEIRMHAYLNGTSCTLH
ncbi:protein eva-1 homolog C isoform X2 [Pygocentrus nattereri]|uniref:protein eva-1 homolog C isoform X2 n=1 Tax=Pygocentrus nattereri TaxID=42514 RepID=UPI0018910CB9|nr:protein eva-1 homolog C isoform X2 [Pygocentrus nattereri]